MIKAKTLHRACWVGLAIVTVGSGCTHNYYYGGTPGCPPYGQTVTTQLGQVCEAPSGTVVTSNAPPAVASDITTSTPIVANSNPQRIVISQPAYNPSLSNRLGWRRPSNESPPTTRVTGTLNDSVVK